jgi:hypothetical protein
VLFGGRALRLRLGRSGPGEPRPHPSRLSARYHRGGHGDASTARPPARSPPGAPSPPRRRRAAHAEEFEALVQSAGWKVEKSLDTPLQLHFRLAKTPD